jgi:DNA-binding PadR family transcriptional regulator
MTNAELAILSLIVEEPRHGYQIEQVIEHRGMRNWTEIGFSSIYFILRKLEKKGLIESHSAPSEGKGPGRKVYSPTEAGRQAWHAAALESFSTVAPRHNPFLIGLSVQPAFSQEEALKALETYRDHLIQEHDFVKRRWEDQSAEYDLPSHVAAMYDYSLNLIQAELNWIDGYIRTLKN